MTTLTEQDLETLLALERQSPGAAPAVGSTHQQLLLALAEPANLEAALFFVWARMDDPDPGLWTLIQRLVYQLLAQDSLQSTLRRFHRLLGGVADLAAFREQTVEDFLVWLYLHKEKLVQVAEKATPQRFFHRLCKNLLANEARTRYRKTADAGWQLRHESLDADAPTRDPGELLTGFYQEPDDGSDPFRGLHIEAMTPAEQAEALAGVALHPEGVRQAARTFLQHLAHQPAGGKHRHATPPDWALILLCCVRSALNPGGLRPSHVDPEKLPNVSNLLRQLGLVPDLNRYADYSTTVIGQWLFGSLGLKQWREPVRAVWAALQILAETARSGYHYDSDAYRKSIPP